MAKTTNTVIWDIEDALRARWEKTGNADSTLRCHRETCRPFLRYAVGPDADRIDIGAIATRYGRVLVEPDDTMPIGSWRLE